MNMMNGLVWGLIIALIALGLVLIFGLIKILNISHGELYMLGGIFGWYLIQYTQNFWLALVLSPLLVSVIGLFIERGVLRPTEDKPIKTLIVTLGISLILQYTVYWFYGGSPQRIVEPFQYYLTFFGSGYSGYRIFVALLSMVVIALLGLFSAEDPNRTLDPCGQAGSGDGYCCRNSDQKGDHDHLRLGFILSCIGRNPRCSHSLGRFSNGFRNLAHGLHGGDHRRSWESHRGIGSKHIDRRTGGDFVGIRQSHHLPCPILDIDVHRSVEKT